MRNVTCKLHVFALCLAMSSLALPMRAAPRFTEWGPPTNLGPAVNSAFQDAAPAISKDGRSLYFTSDRPGYGGNDIWVSQRSSDTEAWGPAVNLGPAINTDGFDGVPALSRDGHWLFFHSNRAGGFGNLDLWVSWRAHTHDDFGWDTPVNLGPGVNSPFVDAGAAYVENDEAGTPLLFFGSNRPGLGAAGTFDIYVSQLTPTGSFAPATLVAEVQSAANDQRPSVRFDVLEMFFVSDRPGSLGSDLWVSTRDSVVGPWLPPQNLGWVVNSPSSEVTPTISSDRRTLFFGSNRPDGLGGLDLYMTTRAR